MPTTDASPFIIEPEGLPEPVSWREIFGDDSPVELEIGSGKGLFLANAATARSDRNFFGIELAKKYARRAAGRVAKLGLANVRMLPGDARSFMARHCPPASLRAVHVYFPDPWWKHRHRKRRVFAEPLVLDIERTLVDGGDLCVATDVEEYFGVIQDLMASRHLFSRQATPGIRDPEHDLDYLTNFERKYRIEGRPIFRSHYRLDRGPSPSTAT